MRPNFEIKEQYVGTNDTTAYTFDFKIEELDQLLIIMLDAAGVEIAAPNGRVRGTDTTIMLSSVTFDGEEGGGTINLKANLPTDYGLIILLANDTPNQPNKFRNMGSFTLRLFENALDRVVGAVQRVSWLSNRSIRINDTEEGSDFDPQLPKGLQANRVIMVNPTGTGLVQGPTPQELAQASADAAAVALAVAAAAASAVTATAGATTATAQATAAAGSATAAAASAVAAASSAVAAAASAASIQGFVHTGPFAAIAPNANADLLGELTDHTLFTQIDYVARIQRGTAVFNRQSFSIVYRNGTWELILGEQRWGNQDSGVTFTVNAGTGQINAAVANDGGSNAVIDVSKIKWAV